MLRFFFFNDPATTEIYTLSLHDALPILRSLKLRVDVIAMSATPIPRTLQMSLAGLRATSEACAGSASPTSRSRSEEHTSELQSRLHLVCRLLLEKKKNHQAIPDHRRHNQ